MKEALIIVKGKVQGVFFRATARTQALALGVTGHAKNLDNGDVEILAQGSEQAVLSLIEWAKKGPSTARVDDFQITWRKISQKFSDFTTH